jgi:hypothetical protein
MPDDITKTDAEAVIKEVVDNTTSAPVVYLLSRTDILNAMDLKHEDVDVPEWGGTVRVRGLKGVERDEFESSIVVTNPDGTTRVESKAMRARLVSLTVVADNDVRLFTQDDVGALGQKSAAALERVFDVAMKLAGMSKDEVEKLGKDSEETPSDDSSLDSPSS